MKHGSGSTFAGRKRLNSAAFSADAPVHGPSTGETEWPLWVPPGKWVAWPRGGTVHTGPKTVVRNYSATEIPLLVRAGAIIPMKDLDASHEIAPERLKLEVVWAEGVANTTSEVYEDAGDSLDYQQGQFVLTNLSLAVGAAKTTLTVAGGSGQAAAGLPTQRRFEARFRGAPSDAANWAFEPYAAALGSSWFWEDGVGGRTLVGVTAVVDSNSTVTASFTHG